ncbi:hypothetical protein MNBD_UNCLBAC01-907 [hydrothermal vent metagenome]|uniref:Addiction module protein n=1 Tax=hydrothermal vent metagenome TaxID=652676 RepID=A0A3B1E4C4_9ZZZZ
MIAKELQKKALHLNATDKVHLVEMILESLDQPDPKIEKAWVAESEADYAKYKKGEIKSISLENVKKRFKK